MTFSAFAYQGFLHSTDALPVLLVTSTLPTLVFGIFRAEYAVSFGYAGAMLLSGWVALASGGLSAGTLYHASLLASYGARLGVFILWRKLFVDRFRNSAGGEAQSVGAVLKRVPIILGCSLLYLCMAAPLVLTARYASSAPPALAAASQAALAVTLVSFLIEAVADAQKSYYKAKNGAERWVDQGLFRWMRHPNYTFEQLLWLGSFVAGAAPAAASLPEAWPWLLASFLGLAGIQFVLVGATTRLDRKQRDKYGSQPGYEGYLASSWAGFTMGSKGAEAKPKGQ
uniref:Uncharacterized protein n=1 Tax=Tetraselmis sp. GSL018 TaxID=582737 RepID=A0A061RE20_9CHLO|mmetsp:Transcript_22043/g.52714  ORF Transcript_22043/g.52714 Transcript_22043/m.52714 type:complete len:284 (+) Transcript_22043:362-1213(+)|eukprot:CAMPEP_0177582086 /NCGR_PEP_ID=MMETSP0419_2-20121207/2525_1 /TAXON_ID=582737 /ORGANISM="Tetraselmis sp., Strain GSL018" /LENGTH=283 /DNA_ID=CAMNT_0019071235 /DNA_START=265 /DNA_END=1116 /DNA_ORIENTATION=+